MNFFPHLLFITYDTNIIKKISLTIQINVIIVNAGWGSAVRCMEQAPAIDVVAIGLDRYVVIVVYHVTILAIGHGLLKKFWPMVISCVLRTAGSYLI